MCSRAADRHVTEFPSLIGIGRVAPGSCCEVRLRIAAEVVGGLDAAVRVHGIVGESVLVGMLRRPVLAHLAADSRTHHTAVHASCWVSILLARCNHTKLPLIIISSSIIRIIIV